MRRAPAASRTSHRYGCQQPQLPRSGFVCVLGGGVEDLLGTIGMKT